MGSEAPLVVVKLSGCRNSDLFRWLHDLSYCRVMGGLEVVHVSLISEEIRLGKESSFKSI